jgi:hypothetical protein
MIDLQSAVRTYLAEHNAIPNPSSRPIPLPYHLYERDHWRRWCTPSWGASANRGTVALLSRGIDDGLILVTLIGCAGRGFNAESLPLANLRGAILIVRP